MWLEEYEVHNTEEWLMAKEIEIEMLRILIWLIYILYIELPYCIP
jgi:hypothetical protein